MTADENAAILRRAYAAFNSGDMDTLIEVFDESVAWHCRAGARAIAKDYEGREATWRRAGRHLPGPAAQPASRFRRLWTYPGGCSGFAGDGSRERKPCIRIFARAPGAIAV